MSKRRINKQQTKRIANKQKTYQQENTLGTSQYAEGLVITRFGHYAQIESHDKSLVQCSIRTNMDAIVAGDKVLWQREGLNQGVIVSRHPRQSVLARPGHRGVEKPVAANITQVIIVIAPKPDISWPLLDSYLIMANALNLKALILLNKTDLPCEAIKQRLEADYQKLGYALLFTGLPFKESYDDLQLALNHEISVFVGQSGVGKSSIISTLLPHEKSIETQAISSNAKLGRHTTSNSRYYHLPHGGALIDSPGVRAFNLWAVDSAAIVKSYQEFKPFLPHCKFRNCNHINSLGCAVKEAVAKGDISQTRYDNFVKLSYQYEKV